MDELVKRKLDVVSFVFKKKFKGFKQKQFEADWEAKVAELVPNLASLDEDTACAKLQDVAEALRADYSSKYQMKKGRMPKA